MKSKKILICLLALLICISSMFISNSKFVDAAINWGKSVPITKTGQVVNSLTVNGITVDSVYAPFKSISNYGSDATYCCAAFVSKFYSNVYGIKVYNLYPGNTPKISSGTGYFYKTTKPKIGDIAASSEHWAIVKAVNGNNITLIEQSAWNGSYTSAQVDRVLTNESSYWFWRWSGNDTNKPDLTINFHANGASMNSDSYCLKSGYICLLSSGGRVTQVATMGSAMRPNGLLDGWRFGLKKEGYVFKGWSTDPSGVPFYDQTDTTIKPEELCPSLNNGNATVTMYAVWEPVEPVVTATPEPVVTATPVPEVENTILRAEHIDGNTYKIHISLKEASFDMFEYAIAMDNCEVLSCEFTQNDYITNNDIAMWNTLMKGEKDVALFSFVGSETKNINERIDFCTLEVELKDDADFYLYNNSSNAYIDGLVDEESLLTDSLSLVYSEPTMPDNTPEATEDPTLYSSDAELRYEYVGDKTYKIHISLENTEFKIFEYALVMDNGEIISCEFNNDECNEDNSIWNIVEKDGKDAAFLISSFTDSMSITEQEDFCTIEVKLEDDASLYLYNNIDAYYEDSENLENFLIDKLSLDYSNPTTTPEVKYTLGDVNDDGKIDAADALLVLKHAAKIETLGEKAQLAAEVTKDGKIDASDALDILKVAAKIMDTFK